MPRQRLVYQDGDLKVDVLPLLKVSAAGGQVARCDRIAECPSTTERQRSGSTGGGASGSR